MDPIHTACATLHTRVCECVVSGDNKQTHPHSCNQPPPLRHNTQMHHPYRPRHLPSPFPTHRLVHVPRQPVVPPNPLSKHTPRGGVPHLCPCSTHHPLSHYMHVHHGAGNPAGHVQRGPQLVSGGPPGCGPARGIHRGGVGYTSHRAQHGCTECGSGVHVWYCHGGGNPRWCGC